MRLIISIIFIAFHITAFAQLQKCGFPTFYPRVSTDARTYVDTCSNIYFRFKRTTSNTNTPKWYFQGTFIMGGTPSDSINTSVTPPIYYSYEDGGCRIYDTLAKSFWDWTGHSWLKDRNTNIDSLLSLNNTWTGTQLWKGAVTAENGMNAKKGITSDSLINTKGISTDGASGKAAQTVNGVQKGKRRLVTSNTTLDGTDFSLEVVCTTADIEILLPPINMETEGWKYDIIRSDNTQYVVKFKRPDNSYIRILSKRAAILRNNGSQWNFD